VAGTPYDAGFAMTDRPRPVSPHLFIYKWEITMLMSGMHRITGVGLTLGILVVCWWLAAAVAGDDALAFFYMVAGHWFGQLVIFCFLWALFHHMFGGIRHFIWDVGAGFSRQMRFGFAWATLIGGFLATLAVFVLFVWM
jgi:succinate dehydrogenase / fumarate reductase cytochrome b subunit